MTKNDFEKKYTGAWPVLITPYDEGLKIDVKAYKTMVEWYLGKKIGGIYANCQSSEMSHLDESERLLLVKETVKIVAGRLPVAATGNLGENFDEHIEFSQRVVDCGVDILMLVVPAFCDDDTRLEEYYLTISEKISAPLGLYECPYPRTYHLGAALVEKLAQTGRFVAYKETSCELAKIKSLLQVTESTPLAMLQANIPYLLESVRLGATGSMNIVTDWLPELVTAVIDKGMAGDPEADRLHCQLVAMEIVQRAMHHPLGVKYLLCKRGLPVNANTRYTPHNLAAEEEYALDCAARLWFNPDGSLKILA
jgi:4-hydroxy-tetrahydrodipicolinate synthase